MNHLLKIKLTEYDRILSRLQNSLDDEGILTDWLDHDMNYVILCFVSDELKMVFQLKYL